MPIRYTCAGPILLLMTACLGGCAAPSLPPTGAIAPSAAPVLSQAARQMLDRAANSVVVARERQALWIPTWETMNAAREAAEAGRNDEVIRLAGWVLEQTRTSLGQLEYPSTEMPTP